MWSLFARLVRVRGSRLGMDGQGAGNYVAGRRSPEHGMPGLGVVVQDPVEQADQLLAFGR
jgi:hypothetical protein